MGHLQKDRLTAYTRSEVPVPFCVRRRIPSGPTPAKVPVEEGPAAWYNKPDKPGVTGEETRVMKMPEEKIDTAMFAPCGMNCMVCYRHCSHPKPCAGCLNSDMGKPGHCRKCGIKDCVGQKGLPYCFACSDFPCKFIKNLEKSYNKRYQASLIENSRFVQRHGLDMFMQTQKETYTCSKCGGIISVHDGACSECREKAT